MRSFLAVQIVHPIRIIEFMKKEEIICNLKISKMSARLPCACTVKFNRLQQSLAKGHPKNK